MSARPPRSKAEWGSFLVSLALVVVVAIVILTQVPGHDRPAAPEAVVEAVREVGAHFHVDVTVHNHGDATAANVQVSADLTVDGQTSSGDQVIDFLSGGGEQDLTFVFAEDPSDGQLAVDVTSYAVP